MSTVSIAIMALIAYLLGFCLGVATGDTRNEAGDVGAWSAVIALIALLILIGMKIGGAA